MLEALLIGLWRAGPGAAAYLVVRALLAAGTSLLVSWALGRPVVAWLRRLNIAERTENTPIEDAELRRRIADKSGTPTMGGLIVLVALAAGCLLWTDVRHPAVATSLGCVAGLALVGAIDDRLKLAGRGHRGRGLRATSKLACQACAGAITAAMLVHRGWGAPLERLTSLLPLLGGPAAIAPLLLVAWCIVVVCTMSNATNITDGLDGLLAGLAVPTAAVLATACCVTDGPNAAEMSVFFASMAGACLGFLRYNRHPARVFMGDTGALAIGGGMACAALAARVELVLLVVGLVFLIEFGSSLLQMGWFKLFRRRILPIAPIHHIPQRMNVPEPRIVHGFYVVGAVAAALGMILLWT